MTKALDEMPPGTHAILVYDSREHKEDVLFTHLRLGRRYDGLVYVCSEQSIDQTKARMRKFGLEVDGGEKTETLAVKNYDEVYVVDGRVDTPAIIKGFSDMAWDYSRRGYGMRAAGEMSCFFDHQKVPELVKYERDLHTKFSFPGIGVCAYNLLKMYNSKSLDFLWPILRAHGVVIMTGPGGSLVLRPDEVETETLAKTMRIPLSGIPVP